MNMKNLAALGVAAAMLGGCTSMKYNGGQISSKNFDYPPLGQVTKAFVGEAMVSQGMIREVGVLIVKAPIDGFAYNIPAKQYPQVGYDSKNDYYSAVGVTQNPFADPFTGLALGKEPGSELCVITVFSTTSCYKGHFVRDKVAVADKESLQQTLLYSGRVGNKINISYREFSNDMARPAFSNDVEYDLAAGNMIGYRGVSIEVLSADNSSITYRVIHNFR